MALKEVLQASLNELDWDDEIQHHPDHDTYYVSTGYRINGQPYRLSIITDEHRQWLRIVLRAPMTVPEERRIDAAVLVNQLNCSIGMTHLEMSPDGQIACHHTVDVEDAVASPALIKNMLSAASATFSEPRVAALGALIFTRQPIEAILAEFETAIAAPVQGAPIGETH